MKNVKFASIKTTVTIREWLLVLIYKNQVEKIRAENETLKTDKQSLETKISKLTEQSNIMTGTMHTSLCPWF